MSRGTKLVVGAIATVLLAATAAVVSWVGRSQAPLAAANASAHTATATVSTTSARVSAPAPTATRARPSTHAAPTSRATTTRAQPPATPPAAAAPVPSAPVWLPFRAAMKVGCVKSNCENNYHGYWAIDFETLANKPGAPVYAAGAGRVRIGSQGSGKCGGPGAVANSLIVNHGGGVESVYVHLVDFAVADGAWVTPNTMIGHVGSSGYTDPCPDYHLHFEVRLNGAPVNPGQLKACHASKLVTYPNAVGFTDWNAVPAQEYAGGPLLPRGRTVYSDGASCG